jgi:hypothetical protein
MKKLALALATTAALGFAAPALAADTDMSATKAQTQAPVGQTTAPSAQTPSAQTSTPPTQAQTPAAPINTPTAQANDKSKGKVSAKANTAKMAHQRHSTHLARHDRGFKHGRYYAYVKPHHKSVHHNKTVTQH